MSPMLLREKLWIVFCWILVFYAVVVFLHKYPVYYAASQTPEHSFFSGQASWFDPWDINLYVSAIKSGQKQGVLLPNLYTTDQDSPTFIYPLYTIAGSLFRDYDGFLTFHALSLLTTFLLCSGIFFAAYLILNNYYHALFTMLLVIFGRGFGWLYEFDVNSADVAVTSFTFRSAVQRPHEGIGTILYLLAMVLFAKYIVTRKEIYNTVSLISLGLLVFFYPYYLPVYFCVFAFCLAFLNPAGDTRKVWTSLIRNTLIVGAVTFLYFIYLKHSTFSDAIAENLPKVSLYALLLGYGFYVLAYGYSLVKLKQDNFFRNFCVVWITACVIASYLSVGFSRFYLRGLFFPLGILALMIAVQFLHRKKGKYILAAVLVMYTLTGVLTSLFVYRKRILATEGVNYWYYLPKGYKEAFDFIAQLPEDGVLAHPVVMNYIPAHTGKKVFVGHRLQSPSYGQKIKLAGLFYSGKLTFHDAQTFLKNNHIAYVVYGPLERETNLAEPFLMRKIFDVEGVRVYDVH